MAGVLGTFMKHSRKRQEIAQMREELKAEREKIEKKRLEFLIPKEDKKIPPARSKSSSVEAAAKSASAKNASNKSLKNKGQPSAQKTQVKQAPCKSKGKKGKKGHRHQQHDLIVNIDLVEYGLTDDLVAEFKEAFMLFDKDEDGVIQAGELGVVMKSLGQRPSDTELRKLVEGVETCSDGTIEFNEFLQMMSKKLKKPGTKDELKEAFKVFDKKNSGYLSSAELRHVMTSMGEKLTQEEVDDMIKEASPSGDGRVNYDEFVSIITNRK